MNSEEVLLEARGIGRRATGGEDWLLHDIWLEIRPGERIALVGPTGAGKTILLRSLALLDVLDSGEVYWNGQSVPDSAVPDFRRHVIYLHQRPAIFEGNVEENLRRPFAFKTHHGNLFNRERIVSLLAELGRESSFLAKSQQNGQEFAQLTVHVFQRGKQEYGVFFASQGDSTAKRSLATDDGQRRIGITAFVLSHRRHGRDCRFRQYSKSLSDIPAIEYDAVVAMGCGDEGCPLVRAKQREEWNIPDPKNMDTDRFREIRDLIEHKVKEILRTLLS